MIFRWELVLPPIPLPVKIDYYSTDITPVRNQGEEGTCLAFASVVGVKEHQDMKEYKKIMELFSGGALRIKIYIIHLKYNVTR